jgi:hypothetical protein
MKEKTIKLTAQSLVVKRKKAGIGRIDFKLSTPEAFILNLHVLGIQYSKMKVEEVETLTNQPGGGLRLKEDILKNVANSMAFFRSYLDDISYKNKQVKLKLKNIPPGEEETIKKEADSIINNQFIFSVIEYFFEEEEKKKKETRAAK